MPSINIGLLIAGVFIAFAGIFGIVVTTNQNTVPASMEIVPRTEITAIGETFVLHVIVNSSIPVNVFAGELKFDPAVLAVDSIDYNTSIADLWAVRPWFSNGDGTLNFAGGTTHPGGFTGRGSLIDVTFKTLAIGKGTISINDPRILMHDGKGTEVPLDNVLETVVQVEKQGPDVNLLAEQPEKSTYTITPKYVSTDLNGDGKQTIADISIFMLNVGSDDPRYDFNLDGKVNAQDLGILLSL